MDLVTFVRARLDEDEAEINQHPIDDGEPLDESSEPQGLRAEIGADWPYAKWLRISKARALREVEVKRRILDLHCVLPEEVEWENGVPFGPDCPECRMCYPCPTACLLAAPYADHPDYDPKWKP